MRLSPNIPSPPSMLYFCVSSEALRAGGSRRGGSLRVTIQRERANVFLPREPMTASLTTDRGLLSTSRKSTAGVSLPAFASYFLDAGSIGLLAEYRCYELGIEILRELMHFAVGDAEDLTVVIVI